MRTSTKTIMMIAGEASGDSHGSKLVQSIQQKDPHIEFIGLGGDQMREAGVSLYFHLNDLSVVGITEVFARSSGIFSGLRTAKNMLRTLNPDLLVLIDYPDFNMIVARTAKNLGIPVLYYISPQVWAWRSGRVKKIRRYVNHMAVILPFEADFYRKHGVPVTYVGHPLLEYPAMPVVDNKTSKNEITIGLLPGSREGEINSLLPMMVQSADYLAGDFKAVHFLIPRAPTIKYDHIKSILDRQSLKNSPHINIVDMHARQVDQQSDLVIVASGTATLEAALTETPMIIVYKISPVSFHLGKMLINVPHIGLANLVAGQRVVPELIQNDATPKKIYETACTLLNNPLTMNKVRRKLKFIRQRLGAPGASDRTADIALRLLKNNCL
jgi:lipid-A-disaccharide synthase